MEAVHKPRRRTWIDDTVINIRQFSDEWTLSLSEEMCESSENESRLKSSLPEDEYKKIEEQCGLVAMRCQYQERVELSSSLTVPNGVHLKTLRSQSQDLKKRKNDKSHENAVYYYVQRFPKYPHHKILGSLTDVSHIPHKPVINPEVVLRVQFFVPKRRLDTKTCLSDATFPTFQLDQEFLVLGCQSLCELRDKIECLSDKAIPGDYSDCPTILPTDTCKDLYKSGFFYISGVFYNDMRDDNCRDYSEIIIKWAANGKRAIGPFKKADMEKTKFIDLDIQLGYPYVYIHQGDCEHLMVFTDLRMFSEHDSVNRNAYPLFVQIKEAKRVLCMTCNIYTATWVVYDNKRLPENPFFCCKTCFISYNYDKNNQKIGNFRAYHYPVRSILR